MTLAGYIKFTDMSVLQILNFDVQYQSSFPNYWIINQNYVDFVKVARLYWFYMIFFLRFKRELSSPSGRGFLTCPNQGDLFTAHNPGPVMYLENCQTFIKVKIFCALGKDTK